jgi:outer membrane lipoprotein SlyB
MCIPLLEIIKSKRASIVTRLRYCVHQGGSEMKRSIAMRAAGIIFQADSQACQHKRRSRWLTGKIFTPRLIAPKHILRRLLIMVLGASFSAIASPEIAVSQQVWIEFSNGEKATILSKFPNIEIIPSEAVGIIQSVQAVNRSTPGTNSGAALGGALGQTLYVDRALKGGGNNYSATSQLGAALLGSALGSSLDSAPQVHFVFNYAVKTLDGQIREVRVGSGDEFTRPVGQCVFLPTITVAPVSLCNLDKVQLLRKLSALSQAPEDAVITHETTGINVNCRIPGVGMMRLEKNVCIQMEGVIEK